MPQFDGLTVPQHHNTIAETAFRKPIQGIANVLVKQSSSFCFVVVFHVAFSQHIYNLVETWYMSSIS